MTNTETDHAHEWHMFGAQMSECRICGLLSGERVEGATLPAPIDRTESWGGLGIGYEAPPARPSVLCEECGSDDLSWDLTNAYKPDGGRVPTLVLGCETCSSTVAIVTDVSQVSIELRA